MKASWIIFHKLLLYFHGGYSGIEEHASAVPHGNQEKTPYHYCDSNLQWLESSQQRYYIPNGQEADGCSWDDFSNYLKFS